MGNVATLAVNTASDLNYWRPYLWSKRVYEEAKAKMYWLRFSGPEGSGMPVIIKEELLTEPGQLIYVTQLTNLTGNGVTGETTLRGTEETLSIRRITLTPDWNRHAVADTAKASKQINQDFREKASSGLSYWMAKKQDTSMWTAARGTGSVGWEATTIAQIFGNNADSIDTIDATDDFGVAEIRKGVAKLENNNIEKVRVPGMPAGEGYYLCYIHPFQAYSLKADSEWIANHQSASERGRDNPLFTGALGEVDGCIVHQTTLCTRVENANSPAVYTARACMMGQEALARGMNEDIVWSEQVDDYEWEHGIGIRAAWDDQVLSSKALVQIVTAAVDPSA